MFARLATLAALIALTACAGVQPAGRTARAGGYEPGAIEARPEAPRVVTPEPQPAPLPLPRTTNSPPPSLSSAPLATPPSYALPPPSSTPAAPAPMAQPQTAAPPVAAPSVVAPAATRPPPRDDGENVVVPGQVQRQVRPPSGDPRTVEERMQDISAWDRCVTHVQDAYDSDPMRPQLDSPEDYCSRSLGMADRNAVPISRTQRRSR